LTRRPRLLFITEPGSSTIQHLCDFRKSTWSFLTFSPHSCML
jgi:hypothetical protein